MKGASFWRLAALAALLVAGCSAATKSFTPGGAPLESFLHQKSDPAKVQVLEERPEGTW
jgi:hypothetical protein